MKVVQRLAGRWTPRRGGVLGTRGCIKGEEGEGGDINRTGAIWGLRNSSRHSAQGFKREILGRWGALRPHWLEGAALWS